MINPDHHNCLVFVCFHHSHNHIPRSFLFLSYQTVHLLFINLLTDSLPALAIGMEPSDKQLLKNKPRNPKTGMLTKGFSLRLLGYGILIAIVTQVAYYLGLEVSPMTASTMAFATLTLARLFHGFTCRSEFSIIKIKLTSNMWSVVAFCTGVLLLGFVLLAPFMHGLFMVEALALAHMGWIVMLAFIPTACIQLVRVVREQLIK